jgi:ankyrin repeat protein
MIDSLIRSSHSGFQSGRLAVLLAKIVRANVRWIAAGAMACLVTACVSPKPAVFGPNSASIETALVQGADPNQVVSGWRPLNYNVAFSHPSNNAEISPEARLRNVEVLLKGGANPNATAMGESRLEMTPLAWAVRQCRADIVKLLLDYGADPTESYYRSHAELGTYLTALVSPGMDPFSRTVDEERALALALLDHVERKRGRDALLHFVRIDPPGAYMPALHSAVVCGYYGVLAALIEKRVDLDQKITISSIEREWTALHLAEALGRTDFADALRRAGARDDIRSNYGETPMGVRGLLVPDHAAVQAARMALQISQKDVIGFINDGNREELWRISRASGRRGTRMVPEGWTGLDDAVRKARSAASKE